jgi:MATE family multidrug resistance protein
VTRPDALFPTVAQLTRFALPAMLAGMAPPVMGLVDVGVLGRLGDPALVAAIGVATTIFTTIIWSFSFLRFTTTGLVAQASGRDDRREVIVQGLRPLAAALIGGLALILLTQPIIWLGLSAIRPAADVAASVHDYLGVRMLGAPFTLALYALLAWLMGVGKPRLVLWSQLFLNGLNAGLSIWFVLGLGWGIAGAAWGTVIAEALATLLVVGIMLSATPLREWLAERHRIFHWPAWRQLLSANTDIVIRTLLLTLSLALLSERSARLGTLTLAANQMLLQVYLLIATLADGVALAASVYVGRAVGAGNRSALAHVMRQSAIMAVGWGALLALLVVLVRDPAVTLLTTDPELKAMVVRYWPWLAVMPLVGVWSFLWDGAYFGAVRTRELRDTMIASALLYAVAAFTLMPVLGNNGLWLALILQLVLRAVSLGALWPRVVRAVSRS